MQKFILFLLCFFSTPVIFAKTICPNGQYWVKGHHRRAYVRADGTFVSATTVKASCRPYTKAYEFLHPKLKNEAPKNWPHRTEIFKGWTTDEKERLQEAFEELPENLWSRSIQGIYRSTESREYPNPATSADGIVVLYDSAFTNKVKLSRILGHELSHQVYKDLADKDRQDYGFTTNWYSFGKNQYISRKDGFVQDDGRESPDEDFANNLEYYLFEPQTLKKITPQAYTWIASHFGDKFKLRKGGKNNE